MVLKTMKGSTEINYSINVKNQYGWRDLYINLSYKGVIAMTINQFTDWVQEKFDTCNIHNELETSKLIVEVMRKFHTLNKGEIQEQIKVRPILR